MGKVSILLTHTRTNSEFLREPMEALPIGFSHLVGRSVIIFNPLAIGAEKDEQVITLPWVK